jgi:outer membrane receptor for ferrienterochelin and colicin
VKNTARLSLLSLSLAFAMNAAFAQETSSALTGKITDGEGKAVAGATVEILHVPTGSRKVVLTDESGRYNSKGLRTGGPYVIAVSKDGFDAVKQDDVRLKLGETGTVNVAFAADAEATLEAVQVTGVRVADVFDPTKMGAATTITRDQIDAFPTIARSINDYVRLDPRITQVDKGTGAISAAGQNSRFNSVTIDGVPTNDEFGLNAGGLPSLNQPISLDSIEELSVGIAGFDVTTSDATGANINAITKSGTNDFKGSVFSYYRKNNWVGENELNQKFIGFNDELTYGATLGGPILQDRLFFFISAEKFNADGPAPILNQAVRGGVQVPLFSASQIQQIRDRATALGWNVGSATVDGISNTDTKYIAKVDWNINDDHRVSVRWNSTKGSVLEVRDNNATSLSFSDHWFTRIQDFRSIVVNEYSDWSDNFSTEFSMSQSKYKALVPLQSLTPEVTVIDALDNDRFLFGGERFRHANRLLVDTSTGFFAGNLFVGDHAIKVGADVKRVDVFNLFLESAFGRYEFSSIQNFLDGRVARYTLRYPGLTGPNTAPESAAADWAMNSYGIFAQDNWTVNSNLTVNYGVRIDIPDINDVPAFNALLASGSQPPAVGSLKPRGGLGLNNTGTASGNYVFEPRVGFNYTFDSDKRTQLRGGVGLFTGSPPAVWLSNNFSETGTLISEFISTDPATRITPILANLPVPSGTTNPPRATVNLLDKSFEMPSVWKASLAFERELPWYDLVGSAELLLTQTNNGIFYENLNLGTPGGRLPDGRYHYYQSTNTANFNNPSQPAAGAGRRFGENANFLDVLLLRNSTKGQAKNFTLGLEKPYKDNWYGKLSYTYGNADEPNPGNEARAITNWSQRPNFNANEEVSGRSNFEIRNRFTLAFSYKAEWFNDAPTTFAVFGEGRTGNTFSYVFKNDANGDNANANNDLFYVPLNRDDVGFRDVTVGATTITAAQQADNFWRYIDGNGYLSSRRGRAAGRNEGVAPWISQFDLRITQALPTVYDAKTELFFDLQNVGNLLNKDWGRIDNTSGGLVGVAEFVGTEQAPNAAAGVQRYVYRFTTPPSEYVRQDNRAQSRWAAQIGFKVTF